MISQTKSSPFSVLSNIFSRKSMRPIVRIGTDLHVLLYRLTNGRAQVAKYPTMLLTTRGRKTGKLRTIPLVYVIDGDRFIVAAAYAGSDQHPTWWLNLQHSKEAEVQVMSRKFNVRAVQATPEEARALWPRLEAMYPYFVEYKGRTDREIPVVILKPV